MDPKSKEGITTNFQSVPGVNVLMNQFLNIPKSMASFKSLIEKEEFLLYCLPLFYLLPGIKKNENNEVTISEYCTEQFKDAYLIQQSKLSSLKREFRDFAIISFLQYKIVSSLLGNAKINTLTPEELKSLESQIKEINDFLSGKQQLDPQKLIQKGGAPTKDFLYWLTIASVFFAATGMNTGLNNTAQQEVGTDLMQTVPINGDVSNMDGVLSGNITEALKGPDPGQEVLTWQTLNSVDPKAYEDIKNQFHAESKAPPTQQTSKEDSQGDDIAREMREQAAKEAAEDAAADADADPNSYTKKQAEEQLTDSLLSGTRREGWDEADNFMKYLLLENNLNKSTFTYDLSVVKAETIVFRFHQITEDPNVEEEDKAFYNELGRELSRDELNIVIKTLLRYPGIQTLDEMIGKNILRNVEGKMVDTEIKKEMLAGARNFFVGNRGIQEAVSSLGSPSKEQNFIKLKKILNSLDSQTTNEFTQKFTKIEELMTSIEEAFTNISTTNIDNLMTMFFQIGDDISLIEGNESRFIDEWIQEIQTLMYSKFENNPTLKQLFENFLQENEQIKEQITQLELATADPIVSQEGNPETQLSQKGLQMVLSPDQLGENGPYNPFAVVLQPNNNQALTAAQKNLASLTLRANTVMIGLSQMQLAQAVRGDITTDLQKQVSPKDIEQIQQQDDLANTLENQKNDLTEKLDNLTKTEAELEDKIAESSDILPASMQIQSITGVSADVEKLDETRKEIAETQFMLQTVVDQLSHIQNVMLPQMLLSQVKRNFAQTNEYVKKFKAEQWSKFKEMYEAIKIGMEQEDIVKFKISEVTKEVEGSMKSVPTLTIQWAHPDFKLKKEALEFKKISLKAFKKVLEYGKENFAKIKSSGKKNTWFQFLQISESNEKSAVSQIETKINLLNLSLEKIALAITELTKLEDTIGSVTVFTIDPVGYNSSIPSYNPINLELVFEEDSFKILGKGMFEYNSTLNAIAAMTKPNELNDQFIQRERERAAGSWQTWYRSYNFNIMASLGKLPLMALGFGGWFIYYFDVIKWPGAVLIALLGLAVFRTYFDTAKDLGKEIYNTTKTATGWVINASWTLIITGAQLNGNNLTQKEMVVRFGARLVVTSGIVYLVESIGIGDSIMYLQYLSYVYNGIAMLSGVQSMLGMSKKLIGSTNLSELKLLKGVSKNFSKFLTGNNVIDNFNSLSKARQLELMNKFMNGTEYNNLVKSLKDVPAQSIITAPFDDVQFFADQINAGNWIVTINLLSQGTIVYTFVSLIDNILESGGAYRQISSYFVTHTEDRMDPGRTTDTQERTVVDTVTPALAEFPLTITNPETNDIPGHGLGSHEVADGTGADVVTQGTGEDEEVPTVQVEGTGAATGADEDDTTVPEEGAASTSATSTGTIGETGATREDEDTGTETTPETCPVVEDPGRATTGKKRTHYIDVMQKYIADAPTSCTDKVKVANLQKLKALDSSNTELQALEEDATNVINSTNQALRILFDEGKLVQVGGGKKKKGSKKNKVEKKKGRKTKRKMYTKKKKGNSKKHKKKSKVKRNTRRK
jgi:hypothetical protein